MKIILHTAMEEEAEPFLAYLSMQLIEPNIYRSSLNPEIFLWVSGVGADNIIINMSKLEDILDVEPREPRLIINIGYSGAIGFNIGDVINPTRVFNFDFNLEMLGYNRFEVPGQEDIILHPIEGYFSVDNYSSSYFVMSEDIKNITFSSKENSFDMELKTLANICKCKDIQLCSLKIVTDTLSSSEYLDSTQDIAKHSLYNLAELLSKYIMEGEISCLIH